MSLLTLPELAVIRRMLRAKLRHTEIARRLGLPVETVTLVGTSHKLCRRRLDLLTEDDLPDDYDAPPDYLAANLRRCEDCGGMVYQWPCLACRLRAAQAAGVVLPEEEEEEECDVREQESEREWETEQDDACAPTGRAASSRRPIQRAPLGLRGRSPIVDPGLRPGLAQVGPLGRMDAESTVSPSPPLSLSPSFRFTELPHAHA